jgi:hypothetical protein
MLKSTGTSYQGSLMSGYPELVFQNTACLLSCFWCVSCGSLVSFTGDGNCERSKNFYQKTPPCPSILHSVMNLLHLSRDRSYHESFSPTRMSLRVELFKSAQPTTALQSVNLGRPRAQDVVLARFDLSVPGIANKSPMSRSFASEILSPREQLSLCE